MNTYLYIAVVTSVPHGEFLGKVAAFDIDNFNVIFITNYESEYHCSACDKIKVDFDKFSKEEVCNILKKYNIYPLESGISNFKEILEETYKEYPELTRYKEEDFEIKDKESFLKSINNKPSFSVHCVEVGVKHPVK